MNPALTISSPVYFTVLNLKRNSYNLFCLVLLSSFSRNQISRHPNCCQTFCFFSRPRQILFLQVLSRCSLILILREEPTIWSQRKVRSSYFLTWIWESSLKHYDIEAFTLITLHCSPSHDDEEVQPVPGVPQVTALAKYPKSHHLDHHLQCKEDVDEGIKGLQEDRGRWRCKKVWAQEDVFDIVLLETHEPDICSLLCAHEISGLKMLSVFPLNFFYFFLPNSVS